MAVLLVLVILGTFVVALSRRRELEKSKAKIEVENPEFVQSFLAGPWHCAHCGVQTRLFAPNGHRWRTIMIHCPDCEEEEAEIRADRKSKGYHVRGKPHGGISYKLTTAEDRRALQWLRDSGKI